jgi:hypothetical protein
MGAELFGSSSVPPAETSEEHGVESLEAKLCFGASITHQVWMLGQGTHSVLTTLASEFDSKWLQNDFKMTSLLGGAPQPIAFDSTP